MLYMLTYLDLLILKLLEITGHIRPQLNTATRVNITIPRCDLDLRNGNGVNFGAPPTAEKSTFSQYFLYFVMKHWQVSKLQNNTKELVEIQNDPISII